MTGFAPILVFVYNRLSHARRTVEHLAANDLAWESDLFVYSDGPRNREDAERIVDLRGYLRTIEGFRSVSIIERRSNVGLGSSVISGVSEVVQARGAAIVMEDDLVCSKGLLAYMNEALRVYENDEQVMEISGYWYPARGKKLPETFFSTLASSWGWATWARAWRKFEPNAEKLLTGLDSRSDQDRLSFEGSRNFRMGLEKYAAGERDTWLTRWQTSIFLNDGLVLFPNMSLINNIGLDGTGSNTQKKEHERYHWSELAERVVVRRIPIRECQAARRRLVKFFATKRSYVLFKFVRKLRELKRAWGRKRWRSVSHDKF
jgi:hypothetical protein